MSHIKEIMTFQSNRFLNLLKKYQYYILLVILLLAALCSLVSITKMVQGNNLPFMDFYARWQESKYLLRGVAPIRAIVDGIVFDDIGELSLGMVSSPWAWSMGIITNGVWLGRDKLIMYQLACYAISAVIAMSAVYRTVTVILRGGRESTCLNASESRIIAAAAALMVPGSALGYEAAISCGNHGPILCCLIITAICLSEKYPEISGVLMAFSLMKPQIAGPFFLVLLLAKKFRVLAASAVTFASSLAALWILSGNNPVELLLEENSRGIEYLARDFHFGIMELTEVWGTSPKLVLILGAITGMVFVTAYHFTIRTYEVNVFALYSGAAMASCFWSYKNPHDFLVLVIPAIAILLNVREYIRWTEALALCVCLTFKHGSLVGVGKLIFGCLDTIINSEQLNKSLMPTTKDFVIIIIATMIATRVIGKPVWNKKLAAGFAAVNCAFAITVFTWAALTSAKDTVLMQAGTADIQSVDESFAYNTEKECFEITGEEDSGERMLAYTRPFTLPKSRSGYYVMDLKGRTRDNTDKNIKYTGVVKLTSLDGETEYAEIPLTRNANNEHFIIDADTDALKELGEDELCTAVIYYYGIGSMTVEGLSLSDWGGVHRLYGAVAMLYFVIFSYTAVYFAAVYGMSRRVY